jgi:hypothetical protein
MINTNGWRQMAKISERNDSSAMNHPVSRNINNQRQTRTVANDQDAYHAILVQGGSRLSKKSLAVRLAGIPGPAGQYIIDGMQMTIGNCSVQRCFSDVAYQPDTATGGKISAHELVHSSQQQADTHEGGLHFSPANGCVVQCKGGGFVALGPEINDWLSMHADLQASVTNYANLPLNDDHYKTQLFLLNAIKIIFDRIGKNEEEYKGGPVEDRFRSILNKEMQIVEQQICIRHKLKNESESSSKKEEHGEQGNRKPVAGRSAFHPEYRERSCCSCWPL